MNIIYIKPLTKKMTKSKAGEPVITWYYCLANSGVEVRGLTVDDVCRYAVKNFDLIVEVGRVG